MLIRKITSNSLKKLIFCPEESKFSLLIHRHTPYLHTQKSTYVDVYMKWKKDSYYDTIEHINKSFELKPIIALKNCIVQDSNGCIPISIVSKRGLELDVPKAKVARFLRNYPSIFEEFTGPEYNLPWFRLTPEAILLDKEERAVYEDWGNDLRLRLKKLVLMSREKVLPFKIIQGMLWYLGLPNDFLKNPKANLDRSFRIVEMGNGLKGLGVVHEEKMLSVIQKNAMKKGLLSGESMEEIEFPLFPSKGLRLRRKIENWLEKFQKLPYVSPYDDFSNLDPNSDVSEKRVVGVLHELLSLFVEHAAERKKLFCLKKYFGLPQKVHKVFERHPHLFYLSMMNKTCTPILKEAYCCDKLAIQRHPLLKVRKKYIKLIKESDVILKNKRPKNWVEPQDVNLDLDLDFSEEHRKSATCHLGLDSEMYSGFDEDSV